MITTTITAATFPPVPPPPALTSSSSAAVHKTTLNFPVHSAVSGINSFVRASEALGGTYVLYANDHTRSTSVCNLPLMDATYCPAKLHPLPVKLRLKSGRTRLANPDNAGQHAWPEGTITLNLLNPTLLTPRWPETIGAIFSPQWLGW